MIRITYLFFFFFLVNTSFSQAFTYEFKVTAVSNPADAKGLIPIIRDITGVKTVSFNDEADRFLLTTDYDFDPVLLADKFVINGIVVDGVILKTNIE